MPTHLNEGLQAAGVALFLYLVLVAAGRMLRRRGGWVLGFGYQLFALSVALAVGVARVESLTPWVKHFVWAAAFLAVFPVNALLRRVVGDWYFGTVRKVEVPVFMGQIAGVLLTVGAALAVLGFGYGVQVPGLLAGSGIAAVVLGFAMQDLLGNVIAGVAVHIEAPYRVGDWLLLEGEAKEVMEINWRATRLRDDENIWLDIPNSEMSKTKVTNLTYPTRLHAMKLKVGADYKEPPNRVRAAMLRAASQAKHVLADPPPEVHVIEFADSAVIYELEFWNTTPQHFDEIFDTLRTNIWYEFHRESINIPFPIRTVEITRKGPDTSGDGGARAVAARAPILKELAEAQRNELCAAGRRQLFGRGERLVTEGEPGDSMFLILKGGVSVVITRQGTAETVARLHDGDCFGEMSLLTGQPRSATVVAEDDCEVLVIGKSAVAELLEREPSLAERLSLLLAERRLRNESLAAVPGPEAAHAAQQKLGDYARSFMRQVSTFFEL